MKFEQLIVLPSETPNNLLRSAMLDLWQETGAFMH